MCVSVCAGVNQVMAGERKAFLSVKGSLGSVAEDCL